MRGASCHRTCSSLCQKRPIIWQKRPIIWQKRPIIWQKRPIIWQKRPEIEHIARYAKRARASARITARGAGARTAGARASARITARGASARTAGAVACASTSAREASARRAAWRRMSRCQMGWRSSGRAPWAVVMHSTHHDCDAQHLPRYLLVFSSPAREESQSSVAPDGREELRARETHMHDTNIGHIHAFATCLGNTYVHMRMHISTSMCASAA